MIEYKNGYTMESTIEKLCTEFKGKAQELDLCVYLTNEGRKCAVGCFFPPGEWTNFRGSVSQILRCYPQLSAFMPMDEDSLSELQAVHDYGGYTVTGNCRLLDRDSRSTEEILQEMIDYIVGQSHE